MKQYIYEIDSENIPAENLKDIGNLQYAIIGLDKLEISETTTTEARELLKFYKLINQTENREVDKEFHNNFRLI